MLFMLCAFASVFSAALAIYLAFGGDTIGAVTQFFISVACLFLALSRRHDP